MKYNRTTRLSIVLFFSFYFIHYALTPQEWHFVDNFNLVIHEAGHTFLMFFGEFIHVLGGSLFQLLIPLIFTGYFILKKDWFSASVISLWIGQNFINVSVYAGDSIVQQLPLLGGDGVIHDWNYILSTLGMLQYTDAISRGLYILGTGIIILGVAAAWVTTFLQKTEKSHSIDF